MPCPHELEARATYKELTMDKLQTAGSDSAGTAVCTAGPEPTSVETDAGNKIEELQKKIDSISAEFRDFVYIISHDLKCRYAQ